jgi:hypothetical protein
MDGQLKGGNARWMVGPILAVERNRLSSCQVAQKRKGSQ